MNYRPDYRPDFSRGAGSAADSQVLFAVLKEQKFKERQELRQAAFEREQALLGGTAVTGALEDLEGWQPAPENYLNQQSA